MTTPAGLDGYRFGIFEADRVTGELRRQGIRIKLSAQPFQVLCLLLEHPGKLLTREQIAQELWPGDTFVDSEHGVNSALNRIREALGDTARNPRYIETLARRGYRFIAPVERLGVVAPGTSTFSQMVSSAEAPAPDPVPDAVAGTAPAPPRPGNLLASSLLTSPQELPEVGAPVVKLLYILFQLMYLSFYVGALANLPEIEALYAFVPFSVQLLTLTIATAAVLIPVRAFILSAVLLNPPQAREKLLRLWRFSLPGDQLWALAPFLLLHHINFGLALACTALLVYAPFAQRSLLLMGAAGGEPTSSQNPKS